MHTSPQWYHFPVLVLRIELRMLDSFRLPPFAGSMFRGALGWALKEVCAPEVYSYLFETASDARGQSDGSRPFLLLPPLEMRNLRQGKRFSIDLRLWGNGTSFLPEFTEAVMLAGERGLGREKARFELTKVLVNEGRRQWVAYDENMGWERAYMPVPSALGAFGTAPQTQELCVKFITPTRLVDEGSRAETPHFNILIRAAYRRLRSLLSLHGSVEKLPTLLPDIEQTHTIAASHHVEWTDWERTSQRQKRRHTMGGLVGASLFRGHFQPEWLSVLKACEVIHVGKATTFGMGAIQVTESVSGRR